MDHETRRPIESISSLEIDDKIRWQADGEPLPRAGSAFMTVLLGRERPQESNDLSLDRFVRIFVFRMRGFSGFLKMRMLSGQLSPSDIDLAHKLIQDLGLIHQQSQELSQGTERRTQVPTDVHVVGDDQGLEHGLQRPGWIRQMSIDENCDLGL